MQKKIIIILHETILYNITIYSIYKSHIHSIIDKSHTYIP